MNVNIYFGNDKESNDKAITALDNLTRKMVKELIKEVTK